MKTLRAGGLYTAALSPLGRIVEMHRFLRGWTSEDGEGAITTDYGDHDLHADVMAIWDAVEVIANASEEQAAMIFASISSTVWASQALDCLTMIMEEVTPPYLYFGVENGDFGYYPDMDAIDQDIDFTLPRIFGEPDCTSPDKCIWISKDDVFDTVTEVKYYEDRDLVWECIR
jgi:hypothetical protein